MVSACKVAVCLLTTFLMNACNSVDLNKEINQMNSDCKAIQMNSDNAVVQNDKIISSNIETINNNNLITEQNKE